jgi:alkaline phosphatase D
MNRLLLLIASALMLNGSSSFAQNEIVDEKAPKLIAGPMLSYIDDYHAQMWLLVSDDTKEITIKLENFDEDRNQELVFDITDPKSYNNSGWYDFHISDYNNGSEIPVVLTLEELIPDAEYNVEVYLDSVLVEEEMDIYTPRNYLADTYFLLGHNLNLSDEEDDGDAILDAMGEIESDFMVWMGNNVFFNDNEADSFKKMLEKYKSVRKREKVNDFMKLMPHIATWNKMDFGLNTSDTRFALKDSTLMAFNMFWPNAPKKTYNYSFRDFGVYKRYDYEDVEIFMLDNRMFKSDLNDDEPQLLGPNQMNRFINEIMGSDAAFKFIISGNSILSEGEDDEPFTDYTEEHAELMRRLHLSRIDGVVFVTSDTYDIDLLKEERENAYPLYELKFPGMSIDGILGGNFARVKVEGDYRKRICTLQVYDELGEEVFKKKIHQTEVSY